MSLPTRCVDVPIGQNAMVSQNEFSENLNDDQWRLRTQRTEGCLILNKLWSRRVELCDCINTVKVWVFLSSKMFCLFCFSFLFFLPTQLSSSLSHWFITWAMGSVSLRTALVQNVLRNNKVCCVVIHPSIQPTVTTNRYHLSTCQTRREACHIIGRDQN